MPERLKQNIGGTKKIVANDERKKPEPWVQDGSNEKVKEDIKKAPVQDVESMIKRMRDESEDDYHFSQHITIKKPKSDDNHVAQHLPIRKQRKDFEVRVKGSCSLFNANPETPIVKLNKVDEKQEKLFSSTKFTDLSIITDGDQNLLHPHLVACLEQRFNISHMTAIQERVIPFLLKEKRDALVKSATGSGKTLAYGVPLFQTLQAFVKPDGTKLTRTDGIQAVIILPTRELAIQSYEIIERLGNAFKRIVPGILIGGENKKSEKARLRKGMNILVSTPGRLIDHLEHTKSLQLNDVKWLIIDEADRLLEAGYENNMRMIVERLHQNLETESKPRPLTVLLSATLTPGVERLAELSLKNPETIILSNEDSHDEKIHKQVHALPVGLKNHFVFVAPKLRLVTLAAFILHKALKDPATKALIFMTCQTSVDFHYELFNKVLKELVKKSDCLKPLEFHKLHGSMDQKQRSQVFKDFRDPNTTGILLATDVAARGLDLIKVDWIIQFSCVTKTEDYIHRVGRTARIGSTGNSLQFLLPSEVNFLHKLQRELNVNFNEFNLEDILECVKLVKFEQDIDETRYTGSMREHASRVHLAFEKLVYDNKPLHALAVKAYFSYVRAYAGYPRAMKPVLPFKQLHLGQIAKSFCIREAPSQLGASSGRFGPGTSSRMNPKGNSGFQSRTSKESSSMSSFEVTTPSRESRPSYNLATETSPSKKNNKNGRRGPRDPETSQANPNYIPLLNPKPFTKPSFAPIEQRYSEYDSGFEPITGPTGKAKKQEKFKLMRDKQRTEKMKKLQSKQKFSSFRPRR